MPAKDATFKSAMRLLAGGVTIVATRWEGENSGLTATAVCSLALSPPRVLACVNRSGQTFELLAKSRIMSVNLLGQDHAELAQRFAAKRGLSDEDRFARGDWQPGACGAPMLTDALASLDCRITELFPLDTHAILIGTVDNIRFGPHRSPLVHFDTGYSSLSALAETP